MRLPAEPREFGAAAREDVVRVDALEAACLGEADERRLREEPHARHVCSECRPVRRREVCGVVDEDVNDAERPQVRDVGRNAGHRAAGIRLEVHADLEATDACAGQYGRQATILGRALPPPRDDDLADSGACDLRHLRVQDCRVARGVRAAQGIEVGCDVGGRPVAVLLPVLVAAVARRGAVPRVIEDRSRRRRGRRPACRRREQEHERRDEERREPHAAKIAPRPDVLTVTTRFL